MTKHTQLIMLYLIDIIMCILALSISFIIFADSIISSFGVLKYVNMSLIMILMFIINYSQHGLYKDRRNSFNETDFMTIIYSTIIVLLIPLAASFLFNALNMLPLVILIFVLTSVFTIAGRILLSKLIITARKKGYDQKKVIIFGKDTFKIARKIRQNPNLGYKIVDKTDSITKLESMLEKADLVFMLQNSITTEMMEVIHKHNHITWKIIPNVFNVAIDNFNIDEFKDCPNIKINPTVSVGAYHPIKRLKDIVLSLIALLILMPLFCIVALIIKITMPGPVFFKHKRIGKDLKEFTLYKFRSMVMDAEEQKKNLMKKNEVKGLFKIRKDPRITYFGKFLRKTCIDELPQIINILKGDMSIVGPRPHLKSELPNFKGWKMGRFKVKPGLTGLWQISGRHELNFNKAILYDIYYIKKMSLILDIKIILKTIPSILFSKGEC